MEHCPACMSIEIVNHRCQWCGTGTPEGEIEKDLQTLEIERSTTQ